MRMANVRPDSQSRNGNMKKERERGKNVWIIEEEISASTPTDHWNEEEKHKLNAQLISDK